MSPIDNFALQAVLSSKCGWDSVIRKSSGRNKATQMRSPVEIVLSVNNTEQPLNAAPLIVLLASQQNAIRVLISRNKTEHEWVQQESHECLSGYLVE